MSDDNPNHVTRDELRGVVRELRLTIIIAVFAADAVVAYGSPLVAGGIAAIVALVAVKSKLLLLFH